jgi:hypothetical protein
MNVPSLHLISLCCFSEERYERIKGENITGRTVIFSVLNGNMTATALHTNHDRNDLDRVSKF